MVPWRKGNSVVFQKHSEDGTRIATRFVNDKSAHAVAKAPNPAQGGQMRSRAIHLCAIASSLAAATLWPAPVHATAIFTQTIVNPLATVSTLDDFSNCRDNQGCLGKTGQVFDAAGNPLAVGNLTDTLTYTFTLTPAEIADIAANPAGIGTLSMTAARDLGLRAGTATNTDFLVTTIDGTLIGNLFGDTVSTCPAGENFGPINFTCGPNYHNDVSAISSLTIPSALFQAAAADGSISALINPTDDVGRLKVFSLTLEYAATVPEPASLLLVGAALAAAAAMRRRNSVAER
jgi:hypothetical protein